MTAVIAPRITLENRTPLQEVIPLTTPFVLFLDPSSICNFRCIFCPTGDPKVLGDTRRWHGLLSMDLFKKVIDDLHGFDKKLKVLRLYKDGEPFLNKNLAEMVKYAKESGCADSVDTTTNGSLLKPEVVQPVIEAGIDQINISMNGMSSEKFSEVCKAKVDFDAYVENLRHLYQNRGRCRILIKTVAESLTPEERKRFIETFSPIADKIYIEHMAPCWPEFELGEKLGVEFTRGIYGQEIEAVDTCPYVFYSMSINADGRASICFLDWGHDLIVGDARRQSVKEIWESDCLLDFQLRFLEGRRGEMAFCGDCKQLSHGKADNIDPWREEIAQRLRRIRGVSGTPGCASKRFPANGSKLAGLSPDVGKR